MPVFVGVRFGTVEFTPHCVEFLEQILFKIEGLLLNIVEGVVFWHNHKKSPCQNCDKGIGKR